MVNRIKTISSISFFMYFIFSSVTHDNKTLPGLKGSFQASLLVMHSLQIVVSYILIYLDVFVQIYIFMKLKID